MWKWKIRLLSPILLLASVALLTPRRGDAQIREHVWEIGVAARVGTLGFGAEVGTPLNDYFRLRGGLGILPVEVSTTISGIEYDIRLPSPNGWLHLDFFPVLEGFRVTTGLLYSPDDYHFDATPSAPIRIGNHDYEAADIGTLKTKVIFSDFVPYLGVGYGSPNGEGFGLMVDLGMGFRSAPDGNIKVTGPARGSYLLELDLEREWSEVLDDVQNLKYLPSFSLGLRIPW
jgi:hypothetical protein